MKQVSLPVLSLLLLTPLLVASGQVMFKVTSLRLEKAVNTSFLSVFLDPLFIFALVIYGGATLLWIYVLKTVPLAYAYSFMALTFALVPVLAAWWLGETLTVRYGLGVALIISGLFISNA